MTVRDYSISTPARKINPRSQGLRSLITIQAFRRVVQIASAVFVIYFAVQAAIMEEIGSNSVSPEAFCPLGGLETLYKYLTSGGAFVSHTHLSNLVLAAAVLLVAVLFRGAFCGWICPLGFLQDLISNLRNVTQKRSPSLRRWFAKLHKQRLWPILDRYLRYGKYLVLIWALGGSFYFVTMVFRDVDPWSALINVAKVSLTPGLLILVSLLVASFFVDRPWCRYACPLGAATGLLGMLSPVHLERRESSCTSCKLCTRSCPMGLAVHKMEAVHHPDCISCLECIEACPRSETMELKLGLPFSK